ncbi:MATE family efflux transporter [Eubacterium sp. AF22-8LB]|uniref:MATE family efflux transporter n=1 Tax=Eubacterium sp. AF22-8LB TaxID=2292232 RepID=UPI0018F5199D|nr:MATE family efflux transporter [Eubacterium sp. AF22-8LB]
MKNHSLTQGSIAKGLLFFVIPLFFSNLFQQLYNTIDTVLVGHFLGDNALAAMGATAAIFELIVQFSNGCGTGFSIVTARYFGSRNEDELKKSVAASLILGLVISIAITIISYFSMPYLLTILKTPQSIYHDSLNYIRCISALFKAIWTFLNHLKL